MNKKTESGSAWKQGDVITIACDGRSVEGVILLASKNGASLMIGFEAILHGHVGMMPLARGDDGVYRSIMDDTEVAISKAH